MLINSLRYGFYTTIKYGSRLKLAYRSFPYVTRRRFSMETRENLAYNIEHQTHQTTNFGVCYFLLYFVVTF